MQGGFHASDAIKRAVDPSLVPTGSAGDQVHPFVLARSRSCPLPAPKEVGTLGRLGRRRCRPTERLSKARVPTRTSFLQRPSRRVPPRCTTSSADRDVLTYLVKFLGEERVYDKVVEATVLSRGPTEASRRSRRC